MHLDGLKVAVLVTDGYEPSELTEPMRALREAGAEPTIVSNHDGQIRGKTDADVATVDLTLEGARPDDFAALLLPGGVKKHPSAGRGIGDGIVLDQRMTAPSTVLRARGPRPRPH